MTPPLLRGPHFRCKFPECIAKGSGFSWHAKSGIYGHTHAKMLGDEGAPSRILHQDSGWFVRFNSVQVLVSGLKHPNAHACSSRNPTDFDVLGWVDHVKCDIAERFIGGIDHVLV